MPGKTITAFTIALALLVSLASITGLYVTGFYDAESLNWQIQARGQDMIDLFLVVPALLLSGRVASRGSKIAGLVWSGILLYLLYTFIIYCFSIHFNRLFLVYCACLGLSFYSVFWYLYTALRTTSTTVTLTSSNRITGIYLVTIAIVFYLLWLSDVLPAISRNTAPTQLKETGLITNPVHIIDLSVFLPGIFIAGLLLLKRRPASMVIVPVLLVFFVLMDITIAWLILMMKRNGLPANAAVAAAMFIPAIISSILLVWNFRDSINHPGIVTTDLKTKTFV